MVQNRFEHIRNVICRLEEQELDYERAVLQRFAALDMDGILKLAELRQRNNQLRANLRQFLLDYEHKKW